MFNMDEISLVVIFVITYLHRRTSFDRLQNPNVSTHILSKVDFFEFFILHHFLSTYILLVFVNVLFACLSFHIYIMLVLRGPRGRLVIPTESPS